MRIVRDFSPSWFAVVMGTGILANTSLIYSEKVHILLPFSKFLFYLNVTLFFIILIPWILRWILYPKNAMEDLVHPIFSNFYPTFSVAMLVLSGNFYMFIKSVSVSFTFWLLGTVFTMFFSVFIPYLVFKGEHVKIDHICPAWFIPPVGLIVVPIMGSVFVKIFSGTLSLTIELINYVCWSSGFFLYISLFAIVMYRFILHTPLPNTLAPTIWINLGPIGAGTTALLNMMSSTTVLQNNASFKAFGYIFWGFGIWWVAMAIVMTLHYLKKLKLPFTTSWWAFTFPLGAYVLASHVVSKAVGVTLPDYIGLILYFLLLFIWLITMFNTLKGAITGKVFKR